MRGREFLEVAKGQFDVGASAANWRAATIHSYYALLLECREAMVRWGLPPLSRLQVHSQVRLRLILSSDADLQEIGHALEELGRRRNLANYDLRDLPIFASETQAVQDLQSAEDSLALLDAVDADGGRTAAAIASIKP